MVDLEKLIVVKGFKKLPKVQLIAQSGHTGRVWRKSSSKLNVIHFKWSVLILGRGSVPKKQNYFFFGAAMCKSQNRCGKRSTHDDVLDQFVTLTFWVRVFNKSWRLCNFWPSNQRQRELFECCQNAKSSVIFMQTASTLLSFQER